MLVTVYIRETGREYKSYIARFNSRTISNLFSIDELIEKAVQKLFGKSAYFWQDFSIAYMGTYGQICKPAGLNSADCITGRVTIDIEYKGTKRDAAHWRAVDFA